MRPKVLARLGCGFAVALWAGLSSAAAAELSLEPVAPAPALDVPALEVPAFDVPALEPVPAPEPAAVSETVSEDIPEEILRTEIITAARSPLTGEPLTAAEYAQLQATLAAPAGSALVNPELRYLVFLLQLRRSVGPILPFIR